MTVDNEASEPDARIVQKKKGEKKGVRGVQRLPTKKRLKEQAKKDFQVHRKNL